MERPSAEMLARWQTWEVDGGVRTLKKEKEKKEKALALMVRRYQLFILCHDDFYHDKQNWYNMTDNTYS